MKRKRRVQSRRAFDQMIRNRVRAEVARQIGALRLGAAPDGAPPILLSEEQRAGLKVRKGNESHTERPMRETVGLRELAEIAGCSVDTLRRRITDPHRPLPAFKGPGRSGHYLVKVSEWRAWLAAHRVEAGISPAMIASMEAAVRPPKRTVVHRRTPP
jgi:hypothetical protein